MSTTTSPATRTVAIVDPSARLTVAALFGVHGLKQAFADLPEAVRSQPGMSVATLLVDAQVAIARSSALSTLWPIAASALGADMRNWTITSVNNTVTEITLERVSAAPGGDAA